MPRRTPVRKPTYEQLREHRDRQTSALAKVLHISYDERMPDDLADLIRSAVAGAST